VGGFPTPVSNNFFVKMESLTSDDVHSDIMEYLRDIEVAAKEYFPLVVGYQ
jgi:hypothetical protein